MTANDGSFMQRDVGLVALDVGQAEVRVGLSSRGRRVIAIRLTSAVGAHARSAKRSPSGVSGAGEEFFFVRSLSITRPSAV